MKISRFLALAVIALMVVAGLGFMTVRSFAQTSPPAVQAQATQDPNINQGNQQGDQQGAQTGGQRQRRSGSRGANRGAQRRGGG